MKSEPRLYTRGKGKIWWADFGKIGGITQRRTLMTVDAAAAKSIATRMAAELLQHESGRRIARLIAAEPTSTWRATVESDAGQAAILRLWKNAKSRAQSSGKTWALSREDLVDLVLASEGKCAVTGLAVSLSGSPRDPYKASIDRIDNAIGYSRGNCRLTLMVVNIAMNVWGENVFRSIALAYASTHLQKAAQIPVQAFSGCGTIT